MTRRKTKRRPKRPPYGTRQASRRIQPKRRHPVVWTVFGVLSAVAMALTVAGTASTGVTRNVVAGVVGVLLFMGIAALVIAGNLSPRGGGDSSSGTAFGGWGDSGGGDSGGSVSGGGGDSGGGGGDGGGSSW